MAPSLVEPLKFYCSLHQSLIKLSTLALNKEKYTRVDNIPVGLIQRVWCVGVDARGGAQEEKHEKRMTDNLVSVSLKKQSPARSSVVSAVLAKTS